jgi:hypothetical protein
MHQRRTYQRGTHKQTPRTSAATHWPFGYKGTVCRNTIQTTHLSKTKHWGNRSTLCTALAVFGCSSRTLRKQEEAEK